MPLSESEQLVQEDLLAIDDVVRRLADGRINNDEAGRIIDDRMGRSSGQSMGFMQRLFSKLFGTHL
jgi:hypothetical protein